MTDTQSDLSIGDLPRIVARHKGKVLLVFGVTMAIVVVVLLWGPQKYDSEAKLYVRVGHETVGLDPTATTGQTISMHITREQEINSVLDILRSQVLAEKVVEAITPQAILSPSEPNWLLTASDYLSGQLSSVFATVKSIAAPQAMQAGNEDAVEHEQAIKRLKGMLDASAVRDSSVVSVRCRASSPQLAQQIVASLIDAYLYEHTRLNSTAGSDEFFEEQAELIHQRLLETEQSLRDLKNEEGIVTIEGQLSMLETQMLGIEGEQLRVARELASSRALVESLKKATASLDRLVMAAKEEGYDNRAADEMRSRLYDLEIREGELTAKFSPKHPMVRAVRDQVEGVRKVLDQEDGTRTHQQFTINPTWQQMQLQTLQTETQLASLQETADSLETQHSELVLEIRRLNGHALKFQDLQRRAELLAQSHRTHAENYEQARIDAALAQDRITNVNVLQPATLTSTPAGPRKLLLAALGLLVATSGGIGLALVAEISDRRLKSPAEVEAVFSLPVVVSIPHSSKQCVHI